MTTAPFADQRLTPVNITPDDVVRPPNGMVLHIAQGSYEGTVNWAQNPNARVSYYFVVAKDGRIAQVVDLDDKAWTQAAGNRRWVGVEHEGFVPDALTPAQLQSTARIFAWLHETYGIPLQITDDPVNGRGLGWHGMGGDAWGGHQSCPGPAIVAQRAKIIEVAKLILGEDMPLNAADKEAIKQIVEKVIDDKFGGYKNGKWTPKLALQKLRAFLKISS